ncbi:phosphopantetheine-binding protein [Kitasatospora sp. NBC_01250]|uniref:phosphopantetheine-binding protein n=1 Tax=unclassified Kitasatospora TaxID=2633591 RepID=UPI002E157A32|nr:MULTISPECIES: phosphopantetheine-binding protein [unclassified Kitasatospora]WSJ66681.1 phosphopantetheine-binding protein [Kitasatospora sp. NBC_01302]
MWDEKFEETLRRFLPFLPPGEQLASDTPLRELGLDSLGTVELLGNLENAYDIRFLDDALTLETFETPAVLWKTVSGLLPGTAA